MHIIFAIISLRVFILLNGTRNELIKLPVQVKMKASAMMGICIYWIRRHLIFVKSLFCRVNAVRDILQSV